MGIGCSSQVQLRSERELDVTYSAWWSCGDASILEASSRGVELVDRMALG